MDPIPLSLNWRRTDREHDFLAFDGDTPVGRIYTYDTKSDRPADWFWTMCGSIGNRLGTSNGHEPTPREAAKRVEEAWEAMKARVAYAEDPDPAEDPNP